MYQVISIGSALVDIFIQSSAFAVKELTEGKMLCQAYGSKASVDNFKVCTGGGASNTAVGLARLGFKTGIICETGRDNLAFLVKQKLVQEGVITSLMIEEKKEQTGGSVILVGEDGERSIMVHRGAASLLDPFDIPVYWLTQTNWIHLSSIAGQEKTLNKIFTIVSKEPQLKLSWNPGKAELGLLASRKLLAQALPCQVLVVNQQEWQLVENVQEELLTYIPQVIVTAGPQGGNVYVQGQHQFHYRSLDVPVIDTTGAGDAFCVGYVAGQLTNQSVHQSVKLGVRNACSVIGQFGAKPGLLRKTQLLTACDEAKEK